MKYLSCLILISLQVFFSPLLAQKQPILDPAGVQNNFLDIDYFNRIWLKSADINKTDALGFSKRASEKIEKGYYEEAYHDIIKAISIDPGLSYPYFLKGLYFFNHQLNDSATSAFNFSLKIDSVNPLTLFYLGLTKMYIRDFTQAEEYFNKINNLGADQYLGYFGLAYVAFTRHDLFLGRSLLKKTIKINPEFVEALFSLGLIDLQNSSFGSAERYMDDVIKLRPDLPSAYIIKGVINAAKSVKSQAAMENINIAVKLDPENINFLEVRAALYKALKQDGLAFNDIFKLLEMVCLKIKWKNQEGTYLNVNHYFDSYFLFKIYFENKPVFKTESRPLIENFLLSYYYDPYNAQEYLDKIKKDEDDALLEIFQGMVYEARYDTASAFLSYENAKKKLPDLYYGYLRFGILKYMAKKYPDAINEMTKVLAISDTIAEAYRWRGLSLFELGKVIDALLDFNRYILKDSIDIDIRYKKASILIQFESYKAALKEINMVLFYNENDIPALQLKAKCQFYLTDYLGAIESFARLLGHNNDELKMYGYSFMQTGMYDKAIETLTKYLNAIPSDIQVLVWRGNCYFSKNDFKSALDDFNACLTYNPNNGLFYYLRGVTYLKLKDINAACSDFKKAEFYGYKVNINYKDTCPD